MLWTAGRAIEGRAFLQAAERMNEQVEDDFEALGLSRQLPLVQPLFPLEGPLVASKPRIMAKCFIGGCAVMFALGAVISGAGCLASPPKTGSVIAQAILGSILGGFTAAVLLGWVLGSILWMVYGTKENARRAANVVVERYRQYWAERARAQYALSHGVDPQVVRDVLWGYRIDTDPEDVAFEAGFTA